MFLGAQNSNKTDIWYTKLRKERFKDCSLFVDNSLFLSHPNYTRLVNVWGFQLLNQALAYKNEGGENF